MVTRSSGKERQFGSASAYTVLVVEDEPAVARFLQALLVHRGYQVVRAANAVEALVALTVPRAELPQAVILDLGLPLESGVSVLSFLRKVVGSGLPVVVLTGRQDPEEEAAVRALGVSAFLHKPADADQVLRALAAGIR
jgi:DNA-binding response OmpR family regulator